MKHGIDPPADAPDIRLAAESNKFVDVLTDFKATGSTLAISDLERFKMRFPVFLTLAPPGHPYPDAFKSADTGGDAASSVTGFVKSNHDAFVKTLILALFADTAKKTRKVIAMANEMAKGISAAGIAKAKAQAEEYRNTHDDLDALEGMEFKIDD